MRDELQLHLLQFSLNLNAIIQETSHYLMVCAYKENTIIL